MTAKQDILKNLIFLDAAAFVEAAYDILLGREVDPNGKRNYVGQIQRGISRISVLQEIHDSPEARQKNLPVPQELLEAITAGWHQFILDELLELYDSAFIRLAFKTILKRDADPSGFNAYLHMIRRGEARLLVLWHLRSSQEGLEAGVVVPGLDRATSRYEVLRIPLLGKLLRVIGYTKEPIDLRRSLRHVESHLEQFRGSSLGSATVGLLSSSRNACIDALRRSDRPKLSESPDASVMVRGNAALPGHAWTEQEEIKRILILKLDHMGDFFISVRPMAMLKDAWPDAQITLVCGPWNVPLAEQLGIFDRVVPYRFFTAKTGEEEFNWDAEDWMVRCEGVRKLDLGPFDIAIDLRHDSDTRPCLTRIDARYRVGFASPGGPLPATPPLDLSLLEIPPDHREQLHAETRLIALASLTVETFKPPTQHPIRKLLKQRTDRFIPFNGKRDYVVIAPGAGSPNRTWSPENFISLMVRIREELGLGMILIGSAGEASVNSYIAAQFDASDCIDMTGGSLPDLPDLVNDATFYIGNDTGGGHLAALLGTPTLSIFGGVSDPRVWQPIGPKVSILHAKTPCSYCHINLRKDCHFDVRCMTEISVNDAFSELLKLNRRWGPAALKLEDGQVTA
ncbi:ADP-heptose:LPS heptosyltransferase [Sphingobium sp. B11D3B]|uniref:glycosyltransferase family 9 protein n=1 Tax=Sphingobium sp. B11D3B TaxID=2940575 RepID=UPI002227C521|nr:glycosyltransferase family 9 protein [Sphingobium sp. B11D3B]MCW2387635.1 ADP-heptose:LPS heptosyltransferase [Sphingobium sp. B11D3B]